MNDLENSEFAKALEEAVGKFFEFDSACDKVKEKGICDVVSVKCDASCKIYLRKEKWLNVLIDLIKADVCASEPVAAPTPGPEVPPSTPEPLPEEPRERCCPSCGIKAARPESKYCDYCGEEF